MTALVWILFGALLTLIGYLVGVRHASQRQVDALWRREVRFRRPATRVRVTPGQIIERAQRISRGERLDSAPWFVDELGGLTDQDIAETPLEDVAGGMKLGLTTDEASAGFETLGEVLSWQERSSTWTGESVFDGERCGTPVRTKIGTVICLRDVGHRGQCLP